MLPILIAEDDKQLGRALDLYLTALGFETSIHTTFAGAKDATLAESGRFLFALVDYQLGKDCGIELSGWLLSREPEIRVVLMSGYPPDEEMNLAALGDRVIFLQKPFHPKEVVECFRTLRPMLLMSI